MEKSEEERGGGYAALACAGQNILYSNYNK